MWRTLGIGTLIFLITVAETLIATWEGRADRQATSAKTDKFSRRAAHWALMFELVLFIDIAMIVKEGWWVLAPILAGAWIGKYWAVERRRKKFRARTKRRKEATDAG